MDDDAPTTPRIHANAMAAHGGPYDLTLEFAYRSDPSDAPAAQILVTMSWEHAAAMAKSLRALVDSYEQRVTDIPGLLAAFEDETGQHDDLDEAARAAHVELVGLSYRTLPAW